MSKRSRQRAEHVRHREAGSLSDALQRIDRPPRSYAPARALGPVGAHYAIRAGPGLRLGAYRPSDLAGAIVVATLVQGLKPLTE